MTGEQLPDGRILLVRHGRGRGPHIPFSLIRPAYLDPLLDDFAHRFPALRQRIRVWETGTPQPDLRGVKAVVYVLQDPLKERFPDCFTDAMELAERARQEGIRVVNQPEALSHSVKSTLARIWRQHGILTPASVPYSSVDEMLDVATHVSFPAFVRADWLHTQAGMRLVSSYEELLRLNPASIPVPGCLTPFIDSRESFRQQCPESEFARFYHKKRVWVLGGCVQTSHLFFSSSPIVSSNHGTFSHYRSLNPIRRIRGRMRCKKHVQLDYEYFLAGEPQQEIFVRAARALNLDFVGIDYSSFADGRVVLWDANPHFALQLWPFDVLGRQRHVKERYRACHDAIYELFISLLN